MHVITKYANIVVISKKRKSYVWFLIINPELPGILSHWLQLVMIRVKPWMDWLELWHVNYAFTSWCCGEIHLECQWISCFCVVSTLQIMWQDLSSRLFCCRACIKLGYLGFVWLKYLVIFSDLVIIFAKYERKVWT